uniref:PAS domain-containing protein n=1 Tax=Gadus morhua TaxID=8049 RepID=A0A8C4Z1K9_GADMO
MSVVGESGAEPPKGAGLLKRKDCRNDDLAPSPKRSREEEARYVEELAELIIQEAKQAQVSSSGGGAIDRHALGPLMLEALDAFFLVVGREGTLVFVSDNVSQYLGCQQEELLGTSLYDLLHPGDHAHFLNLLALSLSPVNGRGSEAANRSSHTFTCRMQVSPVCALAAPSPSHHQGPLRYQTLQCFAVSEPRNIRQEGEEFRSCLICVARRVPGRERSAPPAYESFTTRQDLKGKILSLDTSALRAALSPGWEDLVRCCIRRFHRPRPPDHASYAKRHHQDVVRQGQASSPVYWFSMADGSVVSAQTKSRLLPSPNSQSQLYMSLHILQRYACLPLCLSVSPAV